MPIATGHEREELQAELEVSLSLSGFNQMHSVLPYSFQCHVFGGFVSLFIIHTNAQNLMVKDRVLKKELLSKVLSPVHILS